MLIQGHLTLLVSRFFRTEDENVGSHLLQSSSSCRKLRGSPNLFLDTPSDLSERNLTYVTGIPFHHRTALVIRSAFPVSPKLAYS